MMSLVERVRVAVEGLKASGVKVNGNTTALRIRSRSNKDTFEFYLDPHEVTFSGCCKMSALLAFERTQTRVEIN